MVPDPMPRSSGRSPFWPSLKRSYSCLLLGAWFILGTAACGRDEVEKLASTVQSLIEQRDYEKAESILRRSITEAEATLGPDHLKVGRILVLLGLVHSRLGDDGEALAVYGRSLTILQRETAPGDPDLLLVQNNLAGTYHNLGFAEMAEELYGDALQGAISIYGPIHFTVAASTSNLAALYKEMGFYDKAEALYREALRISKEALGPDHPRVATVMDNLGQLYSNLGRYAEAEPLLLRALAIKEATLGQDHPSVATSWNNLGTLYLRMYRYDDAEMCLRRAVEILETVSGPQHPDLLSVLANLAELLSWRGQDAEAERLYQRVEEAYEAVPEFGLAYGVSLANQAVSYQRQGELALADVTYQLADIMYLAYLFTLDDPRYATLQNNRGMLSAWLGDFDEAERLLRDALRINEGTLGPDHPQVAETVSNLAQVLTRAGRHSEAMQFANHAISILNNAAGGQATWPVAHRTRAYLYRLSGDLSSALSDMETALVALAKMRPHLGGDDEVRAGFMEGYDSYFDLMVSWQLEAGEREVALNWLERGRARVLLDQLAEAQIDLRSSIPAAELEPLEARETDARSRQSTYQTRITSLGSRSDLSTAERDERVALLRDSLELADAEYRQVYQDIKSASPLWQDLLTSGGEPVGLAQMQSELVPDDGLLLIYEVGDSASHVFVIPPEGEQLEVVSLDVTSESLDELVPRGAIRAADGSSGLSTLRGALFPDGLWDRVQGAEEVIVIPDGALHRLPFEALVVSGDGEDARYWLDDGPPVRYAASATALYNVERRSASAGSGVLSVSDPTFDLGDILRGGLDREPVIKNRADVVRAGFERAGGSLDRLPYTAEETEAIRAAFGSEEVVALQELDATEQNVREAVGGDHRYLHLATHGLVDERRGSMYASLALTPVSGTDPEPEDDGFLELHEVYGLDLGSIALAVLSACETNVGESYAGEGMFALSRGFLAAGAQRVVATQWQVDDQATAVLIGHFFEVIAEAERAGETVDYARALRDAKLRVRNDADNPRWADPYYWAAFTITGQR
jgi:CHAT domain-containing protein/tetratricopeptide (TPR) repeat protein